MLTGGITIVERHSSKSTMRNKMIKKCIFWVEVNLYKHDVLVCVGVTAADALKKVKNQEKDYIQFIKDNEGLFDKVLNDKYAYALKNNKTGHILLILGTPNDTWDYWELVLHETCHIVQYITELKMLEGEIEAQAYLHEYLFRTIRRKLSGHDK
jgi:hypothetical protein